MSLRLNQSKGNETVVERRDAGANAMNVDGGTARLTSDTGSPAKYHFRVGNCVSARLCPTPNAHRVGIPLSLSTQPGVSSPHRTTAADTFEDEESNLDSTPLTTNGGAVGALVECRWECVWSVHGVGGYTSGALMEVGVDWEDGIQEPWHPCREHDLNGLQSCCRRAAARTEIIAFWSTFCGARNNSLRKAIQFLLFSGSLSAPQFLLFTAVPKVIQNTIALLTESFDFAPLKIGIGPEEAPETKDFWEFSDTTPLVAGGVGLGSTASC
ncbi:hypothetical protein R3P38DRAFT_2787843 [Favolaschia claudopus]|uniref:Uncharacterized protein n=1 Tax=Favolaschia claudopus TaxID=2862362 RepID=A0AAW0AN04_9AGAR